MRARARARLRLRLRLRLLQRLRRRKPRRRGRWGGANLDAVAEHPLRVQPRVLVPVLLGDRHVGAARQQLVRRDLAEEVGLLEIGGDRGRWVSWRSAEIEAGGPW